MAIGEDGESGKRRRSAVCAASATPGTSAALAPTAPCADGGAAHEWAAASAEPDALPFWQSEPHPKLLIIDLDQTLWPFDAAQPRYGPPHRRQGGCGTPSVRCCGAMAVAFVEAIAVVREVSAWWRVGVASANARRDVCCSLLSELGLVAGSGCAQSPGGTPCGSGDRGIEPELMEIYGGSKSIHLQRIAKTSGVAPSETLFFDDRLVNVAAARKLGVAAHQVSPLRGLTRAAFAAGLAEWRSQRLSKAAMATWIRSGKLPRLGDEAGSAAAVGASGASLGAVATVIAEDDSPALATSEPGSLAVPVVVDLREEEC
mmetsp:Transcript_91072/g.253563  ORF Transcript_91072/g.253563 Transcript_91072/m.253563 type:complete len:316 (-) Transcript_91072:104-1051(-)